MEKLLGVLICCAAVNGQKVPDSLPPSPRGSFEAQVELLIHRARLPSSEVDKFSAVQNDLLPVLRRRWPDCRVTPVGPAVVGLTMTTGTEIDFHIHLPGNIDHAADTLVLLAERSLQKFPRLFEKIETFPNFSTPYLELTHKPTKMTVDLVFSGFVYEHDNLVLKYLMTLDHRVYPLTMVLRFLAEVLGLRVARQLTSIVCCSLFVFYLQQISVLPPVFTLQKNKVQYVDNWNIAFEESYQDLYLTDNSDSMYTILGGFFEYYSKFDFGNHVISPFTGMAYRREFFKDTSHVPKVFQNYIYNVENNLSKPLNITSPLCLTGIFNHANNIIKMVPKAQALKILNFFRTAAELYRNVSETEFLGALLTMKIGENNNFSLDSVASDDLIKVSSGAPARVIQK